MGLSDTGCVSLAQVMGPSTLGLLRQPGGLPDNPLSPSLSLYLSLSLSLPPPLFLHLSLAMLCWVWCVSLTQQIRPVMLDFNAWI